MAASAGTVTLNLDANSVKLLRELQKAERSTRNSTSKMSIDFKRMAANVARAAAVAVTAVAAITAKLTTDGLRMVDSQAKMARAVGGTNDALKALQMAAGDAGLEGLDSALVRMNRRLGAAEFGAGAAAVTVKALKLDLAALSKLDIDARLQSISRSLIDSGVSAEQAARHLQNLGFEQAQASEFFRTGITDISRYKNEIKGLGLSLSEMDSKLIENANDAMGVFGDILDGIKQRLAVQFAPLITQISDDIQAMAMKTGGFGEEIGNAFNYGVRAVGLFANGIRGIHVIVKGLEVAFYGFALVVNKIMQGLNSAVGYVLDAIYEKINLLITQMNKIPGIDIGQIGASSFTKVAEDFAGYAEIMKTSMNAAIQELHTLAMEPIPSEQIEAYIARAVDTAERAAAAMNSVTLQEFGEFTGAASELTERFAAIQEQAAKSMQTAFADFFFDPFKDGLRGMAEGFINVVRRMIAETMALRAIMALAGLGGPIGSFFSAALPSRDSGGRGVAGQPYMIGKGAQPEVFIPDSAGTFVPNADQMGGSSMTINVDARDPGAEGRIRDMINREMAPQIIAAARGSTVAALRRPRFA